MAHASHAKNHVTRIWRTLIAVVLILGIVANPVPTWAMAHSDSRAAQTIGEPQADPVLGEQTLQQYDTDPLPETPNTEPAPVVELVDELPQSQEGATPSENAPPTHCPATAEDVSQVGDASSADAQKQATEQKRSYEEESALASMGPNEKEGIVVSMQDDDGLAVTAQSTSYYYAALYPSGELRLGTSFPASGYSTYWFMSSDDTSFPWRDYSYRDKVTKVRTVSRIKVNYAYEMFDSMSNVTSIDLSMMDVSECTSFRYMFWYCSSLTTLNMSGWTITDWRTDSTGMYNGCEKLSKVTVGDSFRFCVQLPEYNVGGHTDWYSTTAKAWFTSYEIYLNRDRTADTYVKHPPAVKKRSIGSSYVKASIATKAWTGKRVKPNPTVRWKGTKLTRGRHYKIVGFGKNKLGTKKSKKNWVKIKGIGRYKGTRKVYFAIKKPTVVYRASMQRTGWQGWKKNGKAAGAAGKGLRMEAVRIKLSNKPVKGGIKYRAQVQGIGWQGWRSNGKPAGTTGKSRRLEAIQIKLTGAMAKKYDVWYRVHAQHFGWMGWTKNGKPAGTQGYGYRVESIQVRLLPKKHRAPGSTRRPFSKKKDYYVLKRDTWRFENFTAKLSPSIYQKCFGSSKGYYLWYYTTDDNGYMDGHCYGMAVTPSSIKKHRYPSLSSFGASKLYNVSGGTRSSSINMSAKTLVQYAQVTQYDDRIQDDKSRNIFNTQGLINAARTHATGGTGITISLMGPKGSHAVMPLSVSDTSKKTVIRVYDSNHPTQAQKLCFYKKGGLYRSWSYSDDYDYTRYTFATGANDVKTIMRGGGRSTYNFSDGKYLVAATSDVTVESQGREYRLSPDTYNEDVIPITSLGSQSQFGTNLYWVSFNPQNVTIKDLNEDTTITLCTEDASVEVEAQRDSEVTLSTLNNEGCDVELAGNEGDAFAVNYSQFDGVESKPQTTTATGKITSDIGVTTQDDNAGETVVGPVRVRTSVRGTSA